jgi:NAD(P)-dependent dehydrogenase (short-subunit alcohol dehydrogenase family)
MRPIEEQTVLVTGATDGIGEEIARQLAARGAGVIVHGRDAERAEAARERTGAAEVALADLASFAQVRAMIDDVGGRHGRLDGLVNNAGIGYGTAPPRNSRTEDGHEPTWQVNFLSAFLLTEGLREHLRGGRVVHVSSGVHSSGSVDLERPDEPRFATPYAQSKIALMMLAREQGERWAGDGGPAVNSCSPGWIATKMGGRGGGALADGADTPVWLLTEPSLDGVTGRYFWHRREEEPNPQTEDADARRRLVELASQGVGRPGPVRRSSRT